MVDSLVVVKYKNLCMTDLCLSIAMRSADIAMHIVAMLAMTNMTDHAVCTCHKKCHKLKSLENGIVPVR